MKHILKIKQFLLTKLGMGVQELQFGLTETFESDLFGLRKIFLN